MRVYTNSALRNAVSVAKLAAGLAVLGVLLFQAVKIWGNDPVIQNIQNLLKTEQAESQ